MQGDFQQRYWQDQYPSSGSQTEPQPATSAPSSQLHSAGQTRLGCSTKVEAEKNLFLGHQASRFSMPTPSSSQANSRSARAAILQSHQPELLGRVPPSILQILAPHPMAISIYTPMPITGADTTKLDIFFVCLLMKGTLQDGMGILSFSESSQGPSKSIPMIPKVSHLRFSIG
jgi:hypothetical protein